MKTCNGCGKAKPLNEFHIDRTKKKDGRATRCRACCNLAAKDDCACGNLKSTKSKRCSDCRPGRYPSAWTGECFEYPGPGTNKGYRMFGARMAHRMVLEAITGLALGDDEVDHVCRNRACANPRHLRRVPKGFNRAQGAETSAANKRARTQCIRGHEYNDANTRTRADGARECRPCKLQLQRERRARQAA